MKLALGKYSKPLLHNQSIHAGVNFKSIPLLKFETLTLLDATFGSTCYLTFSHSPGTIGIGKEVMPDGYWDCRYHQPCGKGVPYFGKNVGGREANIEINDAFRSP
ncbi:hypothetical protein [Caldanaerobius fijiensis]|uniref:hypothetical protein n=1 Tax=Caldanaerobius fijiensis TaxID=456330 RepID=UPI00135664FC|nr:hypothetical protein [Caldanaerobius fijiensis]